MIQPGDADWLDRRAETLFRLDGDGRILAERDPAQTPPRLFLQRSEIAVRGRLRADLPPRLAERISALVRLEPPGPPGAPLRQAEALRASLGPDADAGGGPVYALPARTDATDVPGLVRSGSAAGEAQVAAWRRDGLPRSLSDLGFIDADDVWAPWALVMRRGEIAAICQSARLSGQGAEAGVITAPPFRRRGLGRLVTVAWAAHPDLAGRTLYYSTGHANLASQALAARLGLAKAAEDWRFA